MPDPVIVFLAVFLLLAASLKAVHEYGDDVSMLQVALSLVERGEFSVPVATPGSATGADGKRYSQYGPGVSVLTVPFVALGKVIARITPPPPILRPEGFPAASTVVLSTVVAPALATAAAAALLFAAATLLGLNRGAAYFSALGLVACTPVWHFGRTFMSEPFSLLVFSLFLWACALGSKGRPLPTWWLAAALTALPLLRPASAIFLPLLVVVPLAACREGGTPLRSSVRLAVVLSVAAGTGVLLVALHNHARFGSPLDAGYRGAGVAFSTPLWTGIRGLLFSPGKSVFMYAPVVLLSVFGAHALWKRSRAVAFLAATLFLAHLLLYSRYHFWWGGGSWGPRFLVPTLGGALLALGCWVAEQPSRWRHPAFLLLVFWSFLVQVASVYVSTVPYEAKMEASPELFAKLLWNWRSSPVWAQVYSFLFTAAPPDLAYRHYGWRALTLFQAAALCALVVVLRVGFRPPHLEEEEAERDPSRS